MKTEKIAMNLIVENEYNPNVMDDRKFKKLVLNIKRKGFRKPIEVRKVGKQYMIIDGAHRFRACKELGYKEIDCIIDDVDETEAMIDTLNANIHGTHNPYKEAQMFKQIHERHALKDIEKLTVFGQAEIKDRLELLNLSPSIQKELEKQEAEEAKDAPVVLTFMIKEPERDIVNGALGMCNEKDKNRALVELCTMFVKQKSNEVQSNEGSEQSNEESTSETE